MRVLADCLAQQASQRPLRSSKVAGSAIVRQGLATLMKHAIRCQNDFPQETALSLLAPVMHAGTEFVQLDQRQKLDVAIVAVIEPQSEEKIQHCLGQSE